MSKKLVLLGNVPNLGKRGLITGPVPEHYAKVLIRRGLAKIYHEPKAEVKLDPSVLAEPAQVKDSSDLKKAEIKARLEALGIEFDPRAKKADLIEAYKKANRI